MLYHFLPWLILLTSIYRKKQGFFRCRNLRNSAQPLNHAPGARLTVFAPAHCARIAPDISRNDYKKEAFRNSFLQKALGMEDNGLEPMTFWLPETRFQLRLLCLTELKIMENPAKRWNFLTRTTLSPSIIFDHRQQRKPIFSKNNTYIRYDFNENPYGVPTPRIVIQKWWETAKIKINFKYRSNFVTFRF